MRKGYLATALTLIITISGLLSCGRDVTTPPEQIDPLAQLKDRINSTPRVNAEAELIALWYSDALVASDSIYSTFKDALAQLHANLVTDYPELHKIHFTHYFAFRQITAMVDLAYEESIFDGTLYLDLQNRTYI